MSIKYDGKNIQIQESDDFEILNINQQISDDPAMRNMENETINKFI